MVLGSPVYGDSVLPGMEAFLKKNWEFLAGKPLASFVVCGDKLWRPDAGVGGHRNLEKLTKLLPDQRGRCRGEVPRRGQRWKTVDK